MRMRGMYKVATMTIDEVTNEFEMKNIVFGRGVSDNKGAHIEKVPVQHLIGNFYRGEEVIQNNRHTGRCGLYIVYGDIGLKSADVSMHTPIEYITQNRLLMSEESKSGLISHVRQMINNHLPVSEEYLIVADKLDKSGVVDYLGYIEEYDTWLNIIWEYISRYNGRDLIEYSSNYSQGNIGEYIYDIVQCIEYGGVIHNERVFIPVFPGKRNKGFGVYVLDFAFYANNIELPSDLQVWAIKHIQSIVIENKKVVQIFHTDGKNSKYVNEYIKYFQKLIDSYDEDVNFEIDI